MQDPAAPDLDLKQRGGGGGEQEGGERDRGSNERGQGELLLGLLTICIQYHKS